jgi:hypothetical protein
MLRGQGEFSGFTHEDLLRAIGLVYFLRPVFRELI